MNSDFHQHIKKIENGIRDALLLSVGDGDKLNTVLALLARWAGAGIGSYCAAIRASEHGDETADAAMAEACRIHAQTVAETAAKMSQRHAKQFRSN